MGVSPGEKRASKKKKKGWRGKRRRSAKITLCLIERTRLDRLQSSKSSSDRIGSTCAKSLLGGGKEDK